LPLSLTSSCWKYLELAGDRSRSFETKSAGEPRWGSKPQHSINTSALTSATTLGKSVAVASDVHDAAEDLIAEEVDDFKDRGAVTGHSIL